MEEAPDNAGVTAACGFLVSWSSCGLWGKGHSNVEKFRPCCAHWTTQPFAVRKECCVIGCSLRWLVLERHAVCVLNILVL